MWWPGQARGILTGAGNFSPGRDYYGDGKPRGKAADVRPPGYRLGAASRPGQAGIKQLEQKPEEKKEHGWKLNGGDEEADGHQGQHPGPGEEDEIRSQNAGNGTAGSHGGDGRLGMCSDMAYASCCTCKKVKEQVTTMTETVFHVIPEDPEIEHVPQQVKPPAVKKQGAEQRKPELW